MNGKNLRQSRESQDKDGDETHNNENISREKTLVTTISTNEHESNYNK